MPILASCHCGATKLQAELPREAKQCNCSFCSRTGAVWGYYEPDEIVFLSQDEDRVYSASGMNRHHFCGRCGLQTWGDSPNWASAYNADGSPKAGVAPGSVPEQRVYAINLRMVDGLDLTTLKIEQMDGRNNW